MKSKKEKTPDNTGDSKPKRDKRGRLLPGMSLNPKGKSPGAFSLLSILKAEIQKCPKGQDKKSYAHLIVKRMLAEAIALGDFQQIKLIWNYIEGMPVQKQETEINLRGEIKRAGDALLAIINGPTKSTIDDEPGDGQGSLQE